MRLAGRSRVRSANFGRKACAYLSQSSPPDPEDADRRVQVPQLAPHPGPVGGCAAPACTSSSLPRLASGSSN
eukprot:4369127-Alexandrium_andersonii.AAC.1